ncbi:MAG: hypothetical protein H0W17_01845 [Chloroflexi bacterium]|nr:hypothetical protein [Chloroflexota bacterium]
MIVLVSRATAAIGWLAYIIGRLMRGIVWFAPRGIPWALVIAGLLALGAWRSFDAAQVATAMQPRPAPVGLVEVVDSRATGWVGTSSIVRGPFLDSSSYGAPVQRWYYLLLDPRDDTVAMVARSAERLEERRTRTIVARVEFDRPAVAAARTALDAGTLNIDPERYLVEVVDRRPARLTGDGIATPNGYGLNEGEVTLRGAFDAGHPAADGEGWEYLVTQGGRAVIVRSQYAPDSLPVDVWGVAATDTLRTEQAIAVAELQAELDGRRLPERRLLAEGVTPPLPDVSFLPAMVMGALATALVIGWLVGYPVFSRQRLADRISSWVLRTGDEIPAQLYGRTGSGAARIIVDGAPARFARLTPEELERRSWQFALRDAAALAPMPADTASKSGVLTIASGEGPILVRLDPGPPDLRIAAGTLVHVGHARAALRLRASGIDLVAAFSSIIDRDRAMVALVPRLLRAALEGHPPRSADPRLAPLTGDALSEPIPVPVRTAASIFGAVGVVFIIGAAMGIPEVIAGRADAVASIAQLAVACGLGAVARGVWLRRDWARGVGFTVGWVGAAISAFLIVAAPQCGLWLAPNLAACQAIGPLGSAAALGAAIGLAYAALAVRRHGSAFVR